MKTIEETMGEVYDASIKADEPVPVEKDEEKDTKPEAQQEEPTEEKERKRDEKGRFAKKEEQEAPEKVEPEVLPDSGEEEEKPQMKPELVSQAPASLSAQAKALWADLHPTMRAEILRREKDQERVMLRSAESKKQYEQLEQVLEPHRMMLTGQYGSVANGLNALLALSDRAAKDPVGFIQYFANQRGVDLRSLNQPQVDPTVAALRQQIFDLQNNLKQIQTSQQTASSAEIDRMFEAFQSNPDNIHFEDVKEDMADLLEKGIARDYQDAYNKAVRLNDVVQEKIAAEKQAVLEKKRQEEAEKKAKEARRVVSTNVATKSVAGSSPAKPESIEETMSKVWDAHHAA